MHRYNQFWELLKEKEGKQRLTRDSSTSLLRKATEFEVERKRLLNRSRELKHKLREALENEYRPILLDKREFSPSDAARFVAANQVSDTWIPSPVRPGACLNLSDQELTRLYHLGTQFTPEEEQDARLITPDLSTLPSENDFRAMVEDYQNLLSCDLSGGKDRWRKEGGASASIQTIADSLGKEFSDDLRRQAWRPYAIVAGMHGGTEHDVWQKLIGTIDNAAAANSRYAMVLHLKPRLASAIPLHRQSELAVSIGAHLAAGGNLGFFQLATHVEWRQFIRSTAVTSGVPSHPDHFEAIKYRVELESRRIELEALWDSLIGERSGTLFGSLGSQPEMSCVPLVQEIRRCLDWHSLIWNPLAEALIAEGMDTDNVLAAIPNQATQTSEYVVIERAAVEFIPALLTAEWSRRRLRECEAGFEHVESLSRHADSNSSERGCIAGIVAAVRSRDLDAYVAALCYTRRISAVVPLVAERDDLAKSLRAIASKWTAQILSGTPPHNVGRPPGDVAKAWTWRQLQDELVDRDHLDPHEIQREIDNTNDRLREVTQSLIDAKTWGMHIERLQGRQSVRQALIGWLDTEKRLKSTRQVSRRQNLLAESRRLMKKCVDAVPVWIMPIPIVAENFNAATTRFDVVIIDEAS